MIWSPSIVPPVSSAPSWVQMSSTAKNSPLLRTTATMRRPTATQIDCPSPISATGPASTHFTGLRPLHHSGLQAGGFRHHRMIPGRIEHQFDVGVSDGRHYLHLAAHVLHQDLTHAATRRRQGHLDVHGARGVLVPRYLAG